MKMDVSKILAHLHSFRLLEIQAKNMSHSIPINAIFGIKAKMNMNNSKKILANYPGGPMEL